MKTNKVLILILIVGFFAFVGYTLFVEEEYTSTSDLPAGYYTDLDQCQSSCQNTPCSNTITNGYCPKTGQVCANTGTTISPNYQCIERCSSIAPNGYCPTGQVCNGTSCVNLCSSSYLSGKCTSDGKTVDSTQSCVGGECKKLCSPDYKNGVCVDKNSIDPTKTCDEMDGVCKTACSSTNTSGYCPTGQSCINGTCTTTYSCSNSCNPQRVVG